MWKEAPEIALPVAGEVHLWKVELTVPAPTLDHYQTIIAQEEKERAAKFYFEKDRHQYIVGRARLRLLLGRYLDLAPQAVRFEFNQFGKPNFPNEQGLQFNISHSGGLAVMGFTRDAAIGVDLEKINPNIEVKLIASRFFAEVEKRQILALPTERQASAFYRCWTSKEAFIKAHGQGLSLPLDQFEVEIHPDRKAALKNVHWEPELVESWSIIDFVPEDGFVGAVMCDTTIERVRCYSYLK
ncbi:4'-phosphopantetheinyl transferase family protein [Flavilitoribacter nigricans]|uniref:Phosphopantetheine-protein transferase n=1 Tax=Flavilitoribacter nigricans (strain ATCC 23147 / DSM 23189 / NBRC 102662 / NCIMB 1420 / SS-2) TaxID=1122177 RepID=A0A2D0NJK8_FLAN2|nr:4'-phosphopantetheinyl transferase superfamily protein [Flavilitoribacter nigricans]PHN08618.1 phosphopantetheine-protein transferase [Flavilitoribacter nigricans DSM 23189 = NBRC 102662]